MSDFEQISIARSELTEKVERAARFKSLMEHPSWKEFIDEEMLKDDVLSLVYCKSDPSMQSELIQSNVDVTLRALSILRRKFANILNEGAEAEHILENDEFVSFEGVDE